MLGDEGGGNRTHDLGIKSPLLYQLSYAPGPENVAGAHLKLKRPLGSSAMRSGIGIALCLLATSLVTPGIAQSAPTPDRWQITLGDGRILWDVRLVKLEGESLHVRRGDSLAVVSVGQVTELRLIQKSEIRMGEGAAGAMPALMGTDDEVYDLTPLEFADRLHAVQKVLLYHPPEPAPAGP